MDNTNETRADILREMREAAKSTDLFNGEEVGEPLIRGTKVEDWADRIEAAAKREKAATEADALYVGAFVEATRHKQVGNAAAMREALHKISTTIWMRIDPTCNDDCCKPWRELAKIADAALKGETK